MSKLAPTEPANGPCPEKDAQLWIALDPKSCRVNADSTDGPTVLIDTSNLRLFEVGSCIRLELPWGPRHASIVEKSETTDGTYKLELKWDEGESITATQGNGMTYLDQTRDGSTTTLLMTTKQFGEVALFLCHPNAKRFRTSDSLLEPVVVEYSSADEHFSISQGDLSIVGNRTRENCGIEGITLFALPNENKR